MALIDNIKNESYKKIFLVYLKYIDLTTMTQKKLFISDYYCSTLDDITTGNLIDAEIRLSDVPSFIKELDLIKNEIIVKSSMNIKINNNDNYLTNIFKNGIFVNQEIKFYITTEIDLAKEGVSGNFLQIASGIIKDTTVDQTISINIDDLSLFENQIPSFLEFFDYTNQKDGQDKKYKYTLDGYLQNQELDNINYSSTSKMADTGLLVSLQYDSSINFTKLTFANSTEADNFKINLKQDTLLYVQDNQAGNNYSSIALKFQQIDYSNNNVILLEPSQQINLITNKKLYIMEDSLETNNKFLVKKNYNRNSSDKIGFIGSSVLGGTLLPTPYLSINDNWTFLKQNDIILLTSSYRTDLQEELVVDYFDAVNKRVYLKNKLSGILLMNETIKLTDPTFITTCRVQFELIKEVKNKNTRYTASQKYFEIYLETSLFQDNNSSVSATLSGINTDLKTLTFTSERIGEIGNKDSIVFVHNPALTTPYTPTLSTTTNSKGGELYTITYHNTETNFGQIATLINNTSGVSPFIQFSYTGLSTDKVKTVTGWDTEKYLSNGITSGSFLIFDWANDYSTNTTIDNKFPNIPFSTILTFNVNGSSILPTFAKKIYNDLYATIYSLTLSINTSTETITQIGYKIANALNAYLMGTSAGTDIHAYPWIASFDETTLKLKIANIYRNNIDITFSGLYKLNGSDNITYNGSVYDNKRCYLYQEKTNDSNELHLIIDKIGMSLLDKNNAIAVENFTSLGPSGSTDAIKRQFKTSSNLSAGLVVCDYLNYRRFYDSATNTNSLDKTNCIYRIFYKNETDDTNIRYYTNNIITVDTTNMIDNYFLLAYPEVNTDTLTIIYNNKALSHVSDLIISLCSLYDITNFSSSDLATLKTNHPNFISYYFINSSDEFYKQLNKLLLNFNLNAYIDNSGMLRFKFFNIKDLSITKTLDYNLCKDYNYYIQDLLQNKLSFKILPDLKEKTFTEKLFSDTTIDTLNSSFGLKLNKTLIKETSIMYDFFSESFSGYTYEELFKNKHFKKFIKIELFLDISEIDLEIHNNINIINHPEFLDTDIFKIYKIENNFETIKITAYKLN